MNIVKSPEITPICTALEQLNIKLQEKPVLGPERQPLQGDWIRLTTPDPESQPDLSVLRPEHNFRTLSLSIRTAVANPENKLLRGAEVVLQGLYPFVSQIATEIDGIFAVGVLPGETSDKPPIPYVNTFSLPGINRLGSLVCGVGWRNLSIDPNTHSLQLSQPR